MLCRSKDKLYQSPRHQPIIHGPRTLKPQYTMLLVLLALAPAVFAAEEEPYTTQLSVFGTRVEISIWGAEPAVAQQAMAVISKDFKGMHRDWNAWKPGTLVNLNRALAQKKVMTVDDSMLTLVRQAKEFYRSSDGLFNPAMGQLIALWGFHSDQRPQGPPPDKQAIAAVLNKHPTMDDVVVQGNRISSRNPAVQFDFGGFAKGTD